MTDRFFVYGTLAPGRPNAHILGDVPGTWEPATVRGRLVQAGWGATLGYPGIVPSEDADDVPGFVFTSAHLSALWGQLDEFEGEAYTRGRVPARLADGTVVEAWVYALANATSNRSGGA